jgi:hypothetical protein
MSLCTPVAFFPISFDRSCQLALATSGHEDIRAFLHELVRRRQADAAISSGAKRDKLTHWALLDRFSSAALAIRCPIDIGVYAPTYVHMHLCQDLGIDNAH